MTMDAYWPGTEVQRGDTLSGGRGIARPAGPGAGHAAIVTYLNQAIAIAYGVAMRANEQYYAGLRHFSPALSSLGLEHAHAATEDAMRIRGRLAELLGALDVMDDAQSSAAVSTGDTGDSLVAVISAELAAGNAAIDSYREIAAYFSASDPATQELLEGIVAAEERFASTLAGLLAKASAPYHC